jgi:hypothetical protein
MQPVYDAAGHRQSPVTMPGFHEGRAPRDKGHRYPADPPTVEEIVAVMRAAGDDHDAVRAARADHRALACRAAHQRSLALNESDLDLQRGAILVRRGKRGRRREVGMDRWGKRRDKPAWRRR